MSILYPGTRAGRRTRRIWNESRRAVLRSRWQLVAALTIGLVIVLSILAWAMVLLGVAPFVSGAMFGAALGGYGAALHWIADLVCGDHNAKYGTVGEAATSEEFRSRRMRANGWHIIDGVAFKRGDVDHVAIRLGLVVAVETKWTNTPWFIRDDRLDEPGDVLYQARWGAAKIRHLLKSTIEAEVHAVVAVWGKGAETLPRDVTFLDGVWIVRGRAITEIDSWLDALGSAHPTADEVRASVRVIEEFACAREEYDARLPVVA